MKTLALMVKRVCILFLLAVFSAALASGIASQYKFAPPTFATCFWTLLLLEIAGQILRGELPRPFNDKP